MTIPSGEFCGTSSRGASYACCLTTALSPCNSRILLDGDLDANWIESMNSVMDDNRLLTLPSNERIRLLPHMKLIFEIRDLK